MPSGSQPQAQTSVSPFVLSSPLLTEIFGYTPITVIDGVIDAINGVAARTLSGVDTQIKKVNSERSGGAYDGEVASGFARLTQLFQQAVDNVFDRFEIYAMRNVLVVDTELLNGGWLRLPRQEGVDFTDPEGAAQLEHKITTARGELKSSQSELEHNKTTLAALAQKRARLEAMLKSVPDTQTGLETTLSSMDEDRKAIELLSRDLAQKVVLNKELLELSVAELPAGTRPHFNETVLQQLLLARELEPTEEVAEAEVEIPIEVSPLP